MLCILLNFLLANQTNREINRAPKECNNSAKHIKFDLPFPFAFAFAFSLLGNTHFNALSVIIYT